MSKQKSTYVVLVVDDDEIIRMAHCTLLESIGLGIIPMQVAGGNEALHQMTQYAVDLIVTDWDMPEMNGGQLIQAIRSNTRNVPILVVSSSDVQEQAYSMGANAFEKKPLDGKKIKTVVRQLLHEWCPKT